MRYVPLSRWLQSERERERAIDCAEVCACVYNWGMKYYIKKGKVQCNNLRSRHLWNKNERWDSGDVSKKRMITTPSKRSLTWNLHDIQNPLGMQSNIKHIAAVLRFTFQVLQRHSYSVGRGRRFIWRYHNNLSMRSDGQTISTFCHNIHFTSRDRRSTK